MSTFHFTSIEPQQFQDEIAETVKGQLQIFFKEFKNQQPDELLNREEVAQLFKVSISTVNNWKKSGKLKSYGIGNRIFFKRAEVESSLQLLKIQ